jgi:hypothetical protein
VEKSTTTAVEYTWYVRDASGNVMSVYSYTSSNATDLRANKLLQNEVYLYGSSRIGSLTVSRDVEVTRQGEEFVYGFANGIDSAYRTVFKTGLKQYELSNHLGNVLVTVSDRKLQVSSNSTTVEYYTADVVTATDYYPGGMEMPGRKYVAGSSSYRYGFQNQETDKELWGGAIVYTYRVEDPRLNRFFSVDPLADDYPHNSPYAFAENRLIDGVELEGLEWKPTKDKKGTITGYNWVGYDGQGNPMKGSVASGTVHNSLTGSTSYYTSDQKNLSGKIDIMTDHTRPTKTNGWGGYDYSNLYNYTFYFTTRSLSNSTTEFNNYNVTQIHVDVWNVEEKTNFISGNTRSEVNYLLKNDILYKGQYRGYYGITGDVNTSGLLSHAIGRLGLSYTPTTSINSDGLGPVDFFLGGGFKYGTTLKTLSSKSPVKFFTNFSSNNKGFTLFQWKKGKDFRIDFDMKNFLHYHRRGKDPFGVTKPGQGIGRHRPWETKSTDKGFFDRF